MHMGYPCVGSAQGCPNMGIPIVEHPCALLQWGKSTLHQYLLLLLSMCLFLAGVVPFTIYLVKGHVLYCLISE